MEEYCKWLLKTLAEPNVESLRKVHQRHRDLHDSFGLHEILHFLPSKQHTRFATQLSAILKNPVAQLLQGGKDKTEDDDEDCAPMSDSDEAVAIAAEIMWLYVEREKEAPPEAMRAVIFDLHSVLLALGQNQNHAKNDIAKTCEWLWRVGDAEREKVVPQTMLYLLMRSFGGESYHAHLEGKRSIRGGSAADVGRVYAMRQALTTLELSESVPDSETIRTLLLRCATCASYLRADHGRKFLAYLLTLEEMRDAFFHALLNQLGNVRKERASLYGTVFLMAWKLERSEWLFTALMTVAEKAIYAGSEPLATNLRTVLSSFNSSKRVTGVDALLNRVYAPVLFKNLMVANPVVRKNAVTVLADAFPIHDPNARLQDIEETIAFQCSKLVELLDDPAAIVRKATVEGTARVLGLLWELVPLGLAKKMVDIITAKLAFDTSSPHVRIAVFEGLEFMCRNRLAHQLLSVALKRVGCLIHDSVEKVRLSCLNLLLTLKSKRIRSLRYFDIVPLEDLLRRLPVESPAAAMKIMDLVTSSYFPLEKKGKSSEEVAASQVRACLSMLHTSRDACSYFYRNLNLHVPPGPLCEFVMQIASLALKTSSDDDMNRQQQREAKKTNTAKSRRLKRRTRHNVNKENRDTLNDGNTGAENENKNLYHKPDVQPERAALLTIVADVLNSICPSLSKDSNQDKRRYVDDIFGGDGLKEYLSESNNIPHSRAAYWKVASCISYSKMQTVHPLWRGQLERIPQLARKTELDRKNYEGVLSGLLFCGIRWNRWTELEAVITSWADTAVAGERASSVGTKFAKKGKMRSKARRESDTENGRPSAQSNALFALRSVAAALIKDTEMAEAFRHALLEAPLEASQADNDIQHPVFLLRSIRVGCIGAVDSAFEGRTAELRLSADPTNYPSLLDGLLILWKLLLSCISEIPESIYLLEELQSIIQWSSGTELFEKVCNLDAQFGLTLANLTLGFFADASALGLMNEEDMSSIEAASKNIVASVDLSDHFTLMRPVSELIRICFQLFEHYCYAMDSPDEQKAGLSEPLLETAKLTLARSCGILQSCRIEDDYRTGRPSKLTVVGSFFSELLVTVCSSNTPDVFEDVLGEPLRVCFENAADAEHNLMASTICSVAANLATTSSRRISMARGVFDKILSWILANGAYPTADRAAANFMCFLLNFLYSFYDESDTVPTRDTREFFAAVEVSFSERYKNAAYASQTTNLKECVSEIENVLNNLKGLCQAEGSGMESEQKRDKKDPLMPP